ncbi:hypothetical protein D1AOALGA4SA_6961 [Olavius algarvensis Delta 1 endosymbiont]|nr:hypothetical protein D1AOALGA4SA_6961 [Olavius algarvensis Delta 1 endosymbiont]
MYVSIIIYATVGLTIPDLDLRLYSYPVEKFPIFVVAGFIPISAKLFFLTFY